MPTTWNAAGAVLPSGEIISPVALTIENDRLTRISTNRARFGAGEIKNLSSTLFFPGFTNAHAHLELTSIGTLPRKRFCDWVPELVAKKSQLKTEDWQKSVHDGVKKMIASGVTSIIDHVSPLTPVESYKKLPINVTAFAEVLGLSSDFWQLQKRLADVNQETSPIDYFPSPHAFYSLPQTALESLWREQKTPFSIHVLESPEENEFFYSGAGELKTMLEKLGSIESQWQKSPLAWLAEKNLAIENTLIVHGNYLNEADIALLSKSKNVCVVHCPGSFDYFEHSEFPLQKLLAAGVPVAIGTDSLASNSSFNFLDEIRRFLDFAPELKLKELLPMLTSNALSAIGQTERGRLQEGFFADLTGFANWHDDDPLNWLAGRDSVQTLIASGLESSP